MSRDTAALQEASVRQYCKAVRVPVIGANFVSLAEQAVREKQNHVGYLEALLAMEMEERDRHAIRNRLQGAYLPRVKTLEEFDFGKAPQINAAKIRVLAGGGYIDRAEPVVLIGECGTGKTHLATGLCVAACRQKKRVRFATAAALVNELVEAKHQLQLRRVLAKADPRIAGAPVAAELAYDDRFALRGHRYGLSHGMAVPGREKAAISVH